MITNLCAQLKTYQLVLIIVAVVCVVLAIIFALYARSKKSKNTDENVLASRGNVNDNVQAIEVLLVLAEGKPEVTERLRALQDKIKYLTPSHLKEVADIDTKIGNALGDAKIELSKTKGEKKDGKTDKYLDQIDLLIAQRASYTER